MNPPLPRSLTTCLDEVNQKIEKIKISLLTAKQVAEPPGVPRRSAGSKTCSEPG